MGERQRGKGKLYQVKDRGLKQERELARKLAGGMLDNVRLPVRVRQFGTRIRGSLVDHGFRNRRMRDIAVTLAVFGSLPFILWRPWIGILVWTWLGFMNPHRLAWGFSTEMPFAYIVALTTLVSLLLSREPKRIPWTRESVVLLLFVCWMVITTIFAVYPPLAQEQLIKVLKIQLMIFVAMMLITNKERLNALVLTIALSIGFFGFKGGIFTIVHGGVYRVQGPAGSSLPATTNLASRWR